MDMWKFSSRELVVLVHIGDCTAASTTDFSLSKVVIKKQPNRYDGLQSVEGYDQKRLNSTTDLSLSNVVIKKRLNRYDGLQSVECCAYKATEQAEAYSTVRANRLKPILQMRDAFAAGPSSGRCRLVFPSRW